MQERETIGRYDPVKKHESDSEWGRGRKLKEKKRKRATGQGGGEWGGGHPAPTNALH